jgi:hypothetical protein
LELGVRVLGFIADFVNSTTWLTRITGSLVINLAADESTASLVASYLAAIGTIGAVVVALFLQVILVRIHRPVLSVDFSLDPRSGDMVAGKTHGGYTECYFIVKVRAKAKKDAARNVEAFLVQVIRPPKAKNEGVVPSALLDWSSTQGARHVDIPSGTWRPLGLLRYRSETREQEETLRVSLNLPLKFPFHSRYILDDPGPYELIFELSADGVNPTLWRLSFTHDPVVVDDPKNLLKDRVQNIRCERLTK